MNQIKVSQNSKLPEPSQGQRLILDTQQYNLPSSQGGWSFFHSPWFYGLIAVVLLAAAGFAVWRFIKISK